MKTYYSIISIVPNELVGDSISIGMIMSDDEKFFIKFASNKIRLAKSLLKENYQIIDFFISKIESTIQTTNINIKRNELFHFTKAINSNYLSYLNNYNNNVIQYSEPRFIAQKNTIENFSKLFELLIEKEEPKIEIQQDLIYQKSREVIKQKLIRRVKDKVHTNIRFTSEVLPNLYFNYEMDCIGLNGVFTGAKSINFNQSEQTIQKEVSNYYALASILENKYKKYGKANNFYLISDEPSGVGTKQHKLWEKLLKLEKYKVLSSDKSDTVAKMIEETKAKTFINFEK